MELVFKIKYKLIMKRFTKTALIIATANSFLIGGYHLILPYQWNWHEFTSSIPSMIEWALYAMNFLFSILLLILASLAFLSTRQHYVHLPITKSLLAGCSLFWLANICYQMVVPLPVPESFFFMTLSFLGAAFITLFLYIYLTFNIQKLTNS